MIPVHWISKSYKNVTVKHTTPPPEVKKVYNIGSLLKLILSLDTRVLSVKLELNKMSL